MSGIEIAGLVLAAILLLVASLEHYELVSGPFKVFLNFKDELSGAIRQLQTQHVLFEQAIYLLLRPITMDDELNEMMRDTSSMLWRDWAIGQELEPSLRKVYSAYMKTITHIQNLMIDLATKLEDAHGAKTIPQNGLRALIDQDRMESLFSRLETGRTSKMSSRVKFSMGKNRIKRIMKELEDSKDILDKLYGKAVKVAAADTKHSSKSVCLSDFATLVEHIQLKAKRLYEAVPNA